MSGQLLKNVASNYGRLVVSIASGLMLTPFVLHRLGPEMYGLWALTLSIAGFFGLADLGLVSATARYISHYYALRDSQNLQRTVSSLLSLYAGSAVTCVVLGIVASHFAPAAFHVTGPSAQCFDVLVLNVSIVAALGLISVTPIQCVIGTQRMDLMNLALLTGQFLQIVLTVVGLNLGQGALFLSELQVGIGVYSLIVASVLMRVTMPGIKLRVGWDKASIHKVASFAAFGLVVKASSQFINDADNIVIGLGLSVTAVAGYSLAQKITQVMRGFVGSGVTALGYYASAQSALDNGDAIKDMWREGSKWSLALTLPMCIICMCLAPDLLQAWTGGTFGAAPIALVVLSVGQLFDASQQVSFQVLINSGHHKVLAAVSAIECVANLTLSVLLLKSIGIVGVAVGTLIPCAIRNLVVYPYLMREAFGISHKDLCLKCLLPALLSSVPTLILVCLYKLVGVKSDRISLAVLVVLCAIATAITCYFVCLTKRQTKLGAAVIGKEAKKLGTLVRF